jgi:hypothetical protein
VATVSAPVGQASLQLIRVAHFLCLPGMMTGSLNAVQESVGRKLDRCCYYYYY